ncbi:MAG: hypothetical protein CMJ85_00835 [Planctomycetes bacterium]|nr:hypothetical protein [Planctomycetota bacterium]
MDAVMTKTLHCCHVFATFDAGGPQVRTAQLIAELGDGFEHSVFAMDGRTGYASRLPCELVRECGPVDLKKGLLIARRLGSFIESKKPDIVLTYNWGAIEAVLGAWLAKIRGVIHHEEGFRPDEMVAQKRRRVLARRVLLKSVHALVVPSQRLERTALESWRVPRKLVHFVPNGIDVDRFQPIAKTTARERFDLPQDAMIIGSVGGLRGEKSYMTLLRAFASAPDCPHLVFFGDGPDKKELVTAADQLGIRDRVHFPGHTEDVQVAYSTLDVFALSSKTEQMPMSILEAMAMRLPVLSTAVGDVAAMLPPESSSCVVPVDHEDLYRDRMHELLRDPVLRDRLGHANHDHVARTYPLANTVERYRQLYNDAAAGRANLAP